MAVGPLRLFKYCCAERLDVLRNNRIRFTPPSEFNDPFEIVPHVALADRDYQEMAEEFLKREFAFLPISDPELANVSYQEWMKKNRERVPHIIGQLKANLAGFLDIFPRQLQVHLG